MTTPTFLQCDFHTHTDLSGERQAQGFTLEKLFQTADALGIQYVGYSEHWHTTTSPDLFYRIRDELERLQPRFRAKVFLSAEIDVLNSRGDLAVDPVKASGILDYVSVAISHYYQPGAEQLMKDKAEDTIAMMKAVCLIPEVTMLMHPQIMYGNNVKDINRVISYDRYSDVMKIVAKNDKVVDYPCPVKSQEYLAHLGCTSQDLSNAKESFLNFTRALVAHRVWLAPGSDAHHVDWRLSVLPDGSSGWFGNHKASWELLRSFGYSEDRLWYFENRPSRIVSL